MSIEQRRPAIRTRRKRMRDQKYREVCAELEHMRRMHPEEGCYAAYPKLREANQALIQYVERVSDFFASHAAICTRIAATLRSKGDAELAASFVEHGEAESHLAEAGYMLLVATVHMDSQPPE